MGGYDTGLFTEGTASTEPMPHYEPLRAERARMWGDATGPHPSIAAPVILELAAMPDPPRRLIVGSKSYDYIVEMEGCRTELYRPWDYLSRMAPG